MRNGPGLKVQPGQRLCMKSSGHLCPGNEDNDDDFDVDGDDDDDNNEDVEIFSWLYSRARPKTVPEIW